MTLSQTKQFLHERGRIEVVVAKQAEVLASGMAQTFVPIGRRVIGAEVVFVDEVMDALVGECADDSVEVFGRMVVDDDELDVGIGLRQR